MFKNYIFLFIIFSLFVVGASALNDTTNVGIIKITEVPTTVTTIETILPSNVTTIPTAVYEELHETFYGEVRYADNNPVPIGSIITVKNQYGNTLGKFTITELGQYGTTKPYGNKFEINVLRNMSDRSSRSTTIFINFFVDGVRARDMLDFRPGDTVNFNILLPIVKPTPIPTTIPVTTITTITTITTPVPTTVKIISQTGNISTPVPTPVSTTSTIIPGIEDTQLVIYGLIGMGVVILAIIIVALIAIWLAKRSSREESLAPGEKWK